MSEEVSLIDSESWVSWTSSETLRPLFRKYREVGSEILVIEAARDNGNNGKWIAQVEGVHSRQNYRFSLDSFLERTDNKTEGASVILTWRDADNVMLQRDYVDLVEELEGAAGWKRMHRTIQAPDTACSVTVELCLICTEYGKVYWRNPVMVESDTVLDRTIVAVTTLLQTRGNEQENLDAMLDMLDQAATCKPDIVCFSETYYNMWIGQFKQNKFEPIPGKATKAISAKAKELQCYVIFGMYELDEGRHYNTSVLIGRHGEIVGKYRKTHLPFEESESGILPGNDYPVFDTDFGKIGMMICWDQWFPEVARILRLKGAEVLFVPTIGYGPLLSQARALENGIYMVISGLHGTYPSRIINPNGEVIGCVDAEEGFITKEIDLNQRFYEYWLSVGAAFGEGRSIYVKERRVDTYSPLAK